MRALLNTIALEPNRWTKDKIPAHDLEKDLLPRIQNAGFTQVEIWQHHLSHKSIEEIRSLAKTARRMGITFPVIGAYPVFHLEGAEAEKQRSELTQLVFQAEELGTKWIKIFFGRLKGSEVTPAQLDLSLLHAREWLSYGRSKGLDFSVELHAGTLFEPYAYGINLLREHPELDLKICFQPYAENTTVDCVKIIRELGPRIVHAHFGSPRAQDTRTEMTETIVRELQKANPNFMPSIEFVPNGFPAAGQAFNFDAALTDAVSLASFIEKARVGVD